MLQQDRNISPGTPPATATSTSTAPCSLAAMAKHWLLTSDCQKFHDTEMLKPATHTNNIHLEALLPFIQRIHFRSNLEFNTYNRD